MTSMRNVTPSVPRSIDVRRKALRAVARGLASPIPVSFRRPVEAAVPTPLPLAGAPSGATHTFGDRDLDLAGHSAWLDLER